MLFNAYIFWIFFAGVLGLYCVLAHRWQNRFLLLASYLFYAGWDYRFLSLMAISTIVDYAAGQRIESSSDQGSQKRWLILSMVTNLGLLGFFKYFNFFIDSASGFLTTLGLSAPEWHLRIILPVGISFYTFQTMSYTIDIYRGRLKPARNFWDFALFVSFFPQLVAGPIERASNLLPQIERPRTLTWNDWCEGAVLILVGLFKKVAIADMLAPLADRAFDNPGTCSSWTLLLGLYFFSIQIYADFSGYSDIARGLAQMLGFRLMENFQQPYFSANITEFWRRWHISLSSWLRDYLYIPLGGNRGGPGKARRNLFLTMFLGGLWHGASWTFVFWGTLHGLYLAVHKLMLGDRKPPEAPLKKGFRNLAGYALKATAVFHMVALTWIFFRARDFGNAFDYLKGILSFRTHKFIEAHKAVFGAAQRYDADEWGTAIWLLATLMIFIDVPQYVTRKHTALLRWPFAFKVAAFVILSVWIIMARRADYVPFIYFQF